MAAVARDGSSGAWQTATADPSEFVKVAPDLAGGLDGNGVDLDKTMVEMARNSLLYGAAVKAVGKKLATSFDI